MTRPRVVLVGAGADIGSNIISLAAQNMHSFALTDVITRHIPSDGIGASTRDALDELVARITLANPQLLDRLDIDRPRSTISIDAHPVAVHFADIEEELPDIGQFDYALLATSRRHIRSPEILSRLGSLAEVVMGLAENGNIPALYPALVSVEATNAFAGGHRIDAPLPPGPYAVGSCQCAGWTVGMRVVADYCFQHGLRLQDVLVHAEVDIVHPDTASSTFGTTRIGARTEDARGNLRPGISQVAETMQRFRPATSYNGVSLRVLTQPPGYQVQRFFLSAPVADTDGLVRVARDFATSNPAHLRVVGEPLGSRAYSTLGSCMVLVADGHHVTVRQIAGLTEIVFQGFVHNTVGYCASVLDALDHLTRNEPTTVIDFMEGTACEE